MFLNEQSYRIHNVTVTYLEDRSKKAAKTKIVYSFSDFFLFQKWSFLLIAIAFVGLYVITEVGVHLYMKHDRVNASIYAACTRHFWALMIIFIIIAAEYGDLGK